MIIANLGDAPQFKAVIADRIWNAWWKADGAALDDVMRELDAVLAAPDFPFTLVATEDAEFLGTVTAVISDLSARPHLSPWVAALWVEPEARGRGIGRELMDRALSNPGALGYSMAYVCAKPALRKFYQARDWTQIEAMVGADGLDVFSQQIGPGA